MEPQKANKVAVMRKMGHKWRKNKGYTLWYDYCTQEWSRISPEFIWQGPRVIATCESTIKSGKPLLFGFLCFHKCIFL